MVKLFVTGATGYIGGDAFHAIAKAHPEYEITVLVRNSDRGARVAKEFPSVRLVYGELDNAALITEEASKADIVCNWANCDHVGVAKAIAEGLKKKSSSNPGYLVHVSGTGILCFTDLEAGTYGSKGEKVYDDWDNISEVTSLKDSAPHRDVDIIVLGLEGSAKTAIVCPPTIYGPGRGPGNTRSNQAYNMAQHVLKRGGGFQVGSGQNLWTEVHVHDLSDIFLKLVEDAASGGKKADWGSKGYYFAENGEFVWGDIAKQIAQEAHKQGFIKSADVESLDHKKTDELMSFGAFLWGTNSRAKAIRARKVLGWNPTGRPLKDLIPGIVADEARELNLKNP